MTTLASEREPIEPPQDSPPKAVKRSVRTENAIGGVRFLADDLFETHLTELTQHRAIVVRLDTIEASMRGQLVDAIDAAIERELGARGGAPPGVGSNCSAVEVLSDKLMRARSVGGARGIAVALGPLSALIGDHGALEVEDSHALRTLAAAARKKRMTLVLRASDEAIEAFGDPIPLASLLGCEPTKPVTTDESAPREANTPKPKRIDSPTQPALFQAQDIAPTIVREAREPDDAPEIPSEWRSWVNGLASARGAQPLAAFERLFLQNYVPLANAIAIGLKDGRALAIYDEFRRAFSRAYGEAMLAFAVTGKRPKMVFDAPDVASRIARLHGARSVHLVAVDAMRCDLGEIVKRSLTAELGMSAALTDEIILWSALPTTTLRQMETLARGIEALRGPSTAVDAPEEPIRGRTADIVRRVRVGSRDLFKLDYADAKLREAGNDAHGAIEETGRTVAKILARHIEHLPPRTLLFVFGDHGFAINANGAFTQGGASPEEVLVPAFAFLVGPIH